MAFPNIFIFSILIFVLALFSISYAYGRRGPQQLRPTRGFKEMELAAARNFGKRAANMHVVNSILMEWIALERKMKGLRMPRDPPEISDDNILLEEN